MNRFERFHQALKGEEIDRRIYSLWKHFPQQDRTINGFVNAHLDFQRQYDSDILKISPHGRYCIVDWGGEVGSTNPLSGSPSTKTYPINNASDYENLATLDPTIGEFGQQVSSVNQLTKALDHSVPTMMTIFCPLMVADKLDAHLEQNIRTNPKEVHNGLEIITQGMIDFSKAVLDAGSHGLFIASQHSTNNSLTTQEFLDFEVKYTLKLLNELREKAEFIVFHIHGDTPRFSYIADHYPVSALNWHSQSTPPTIEKALTITSKSLFGGIDDSNLLRKGTPTQIQANITQILKSTPSRVILAPGCVIPLDTPSENLQATAACVRKFSSNSGE
jgi:uroporphyrinogen-III decarboxylase